MSVLKQLRVMRSSLGLLTLATMTALSSIAIAQTTEEMVATAKKSCLDAAVAKGYSEQLSQLVSAESVDADTVRVVLNLTKDGSGFARLTCPYSVSKGLVGFDVALAEAETAAGLAGEAAADAVTTAEEAAADVTAAADQAISVATDAVVRSPYPWWWLLLPIIGLPLLMTWARSRDMANPVKSQDSIRYRDAFVNTYGNPLSVHARPDSMSNVTRTLNDGTQVYLTGHRDDIWVELTDGGWVDSRSLRFPENGHQ
jgi:hypothetical protein